jgi:hypothetical protein
MYVVGGQSGYMGADGVNPVEFLVLVGDADRQWLEPKHFDLSINPIGRLKAIVPAAPNQPDSVLDACIAFCPRLFGKCPSLSHVELALQNAQRLDFDSRPEQIPAAWASLREEARPIFADIGIWRADLVPIERT